jgi:hypothetical protein
MPLATRSQARLDPRGTVGATAILVDVADLGFELLVLLLALARVGLPSAPSVIPARGNPKGLTQLPDGMRAFQGVDPLVALFGPSERIPNVFFKMSRCCRSSAFSRRSAANSLSIEPCWVGVAGEYCLRHRYNRFSEIPSSSPTCRADLPLLSHRATASRLKAGSNFRRALIN